MHATHITGSVARRITLPVLVGIVAIAAGACNEKHGCCYDVVCPPPPGPITVTVSPASATVAVGDTARFTVLVAPDYPDPCTGKVEHHSRAVTWSVSNGAVGTVVATPDSNAVIVRGLGAGTASVIAERVADASAKGAGLLVVR